MTPLAALEQHLNHGAPECVPAPGAGCTFWTHRGYVQGRDLCLKWILLLYHTMVPRVWTGRGQSVLWNVVWAKECLSSVKNQNRGRAKEGSGFRQSLICWVPQESLAANLGSWAMGRGSSSAGASRHIWKQTSGLRLQPVCQVWCVSGKACCEDHHPRDCGGEKQTTEKNLLKETTFLFLCLHILLPAPPGSQLHSLSLHKGFLFFVVIVIITRIRWRNFCLSKAVGKAVVSLPGLLVGVTRRFSYLSKCTCWNLGPFAFPCLLEAF